MARWMQPTEEQQKAFWAWIATRPKVIRDMAAKVDPWTLYMMGDTGHRATLHGYMEDGTVIVSITGEFNRIPFGRRVFGVDPNELVECGLPSPDEVLGAYLTEEETLAFINQQRAENGIPPLSQEQLEAIKRSDEPMCAIETTPEVSDVKSEDEGQAKGEGQGEGQGQSDQTKT